MKEIKNIPASVNARLQNLARQQNKPFGEVLQYYCMERILFRLSKTDYGNSFVLKGGLVFYALGFSLRRPTRDIDFRGFTPNSVENLIEVFRTACSVSAPDDGLLFRDESIRIDEIMADADYPGVRVSIEAALGTARIPIRVDISFTDVITPEVQNLQYPVLLEGLEPPELLGYPPESIVSEKFQAMVRLVEINSRWKDFYDLWMLSELCNFEGKLLQKAILATFTQRETSIPSTIPVALTDDFAKDRQKQWLTFLTGNKMRQESIASFIAVVTQLRLFLLPPVQAINESKVFEKNWSAASGWE